MRNDGLWLVFPAGLSGPLGNTGALNRGKRCRSGLSALEAAFPAQRDSSGVLSAPLGSEVRHILSRRNARDSMGKLVSVQWLTGTT